MQSAELRAKVHRVIDQAWNQGNLKALDELYAPHVIIHRPPLPDIVGLAAYKEYAADIRKTYSDLEVAIDEMIIESEEQSAARWTINGSHTGQSSNFPIPPTGKQVVFGGCSLSHSQGEKIVEVWEYSDYLGLFQQLGVVPAMAA